MNSLNLRNSLSEPPDQSLKVDDNITDVLCRHNLDLLQQLTRVTPRGKTGIFRPSVVE